jgi:hypothetical protein
VRTSRDAPLNGCSEAPRPLFLRVLSRLFKENPAPIQFQRFPNPSLVGGRELTLGGLRVFWLIICVALSV